MSDFHLHIISLDVPWPADYGGVMDIFYKIKQLHKAGIRIHLHCFSNGRPPQDELDNYCEEVLYYQRKNFFQALPLRLPYMVASRNNEALLRNLQKDAYPILMEGIQCSYLLHNDALKGRKIFLRLHNTEFLYYEKLAGHETNFIKRWYFLNESRLLKKYELEISDKAPILALSRSDINVYKKLFSIFSIHFLPAFTPWDKVTSLEGKGKYCLYHGNLGINENERAVEWLLEHVFSKTDIPFIVAGKRPSEALEKKISQYPNCSLIENPTNIEMQDLVIQAQVNVLPSFNNTGVKLKLLNALYNGRHCLVNKATIEGAELEGTCSFAEEPQLFLQKTIRLFETAFTADDILLRQQALWEVYNNGQNAAKLMQLMDISPNNKTSQNN
ncbi:MAG: glycosyltransferase family 4 protein [Ferruginibacter sp.]